MDLDFVCTYKLINDNIQESNMLYQIQLLQSFNLSQFDEKLINQKIETIYNQIKNHPQIIQLINLVKQKNDKVSLDNNILFKILFCYDYFDLFLTALREISQTQNIQSSTFNKLINSIR